MKNRSFLPAVNGRNGHVAPMAARLQDVLAKVVTPEKLEAIVLKMLDEAENGTVSEKRAARQILLGLIGAKNAPTQYVQHNHYTSKKKQAADTQSLIVRYLDSEGPAGPELIASAIARTVHEVRSVLSSNGDRFEQLARNGAAWSLKETR